jgi:3-phenylpropionate/trans-cinnamate dioxygenase ferredoxin reductase subunit
MGACMLLTLNIRLWRPWRSRSRAYRVERVRPEAGDCYSVTLAPQSGERLAFKPGQLAWFTLRSTPFTLQQHPFSIASSARDPNITFTAKALGDFTSSLKDVPPGTPAFLEGPYGSFVPQPDSHLFLIMGGIGVTPAMSMLRTLRDDRDPREAVLIYGSSTWEDITFREELDQLSREINLKVVHVLSEPHDDWEGESGYVTEEMLKRFLPTEPHRYMYFICGPEPLMDSAEVGLRNLGIDWRRIYTERFDLV